MVKIGQESKVLVKIHSDDDVEEQTAPKKKQNTDIWLYIYTMLFLSNVAVGMFMIVPTIEKKNCSSEVFLIAWHVIEFLHIVVALFNATCSSNRQNGASRCSETVAWYCRVGFFVWGCIGIFGFCQSLPLPSGNCEIYMWILVPVWSAFSMLAVTFGCAIVRFCY